jgi:hypothetical protein
VFKNEALRIVSKDKKENVTERWKTLHTAELHNSFSLTNIFGAQRKDDETGGAYSTHRGNVCLFVVYLTTLPQ